MPTFGGDPSEELSKDLGLSDEEPPNKVYGSVEKQPKIVTPQPVQQPLSAEIVDPSIDVDLSTVAGGFDPKAQQTTTGPEIKEDPPIEESAALAAEWIKQYDAKQTQADKTNETGENAPVQDMGLLAGGFNPDANQKPAPHQSAEKPQTTTPYPFKEERAPFHVDRPVQDPDKQSRTYGAENGADLSSVAGGFDPDASKSQADKTNEVRDNPATPSSALLTDAPKPQKRELAKEILCKRDSEAAKALGKRIKAAVQYGSWEDRIGGKLGSAVNRLTQGRKTESKSSGSER